MPPFQFCIPYDSINSPDSVNYDIDFVKVYQIRQNCISQSFLNTSSASYVSTLYQDLTIAGSGGSASFTSGKHHLAGENYVLLQEGFEASGSATVTISTPTCQDGQAKIFNTLSNPTPPYNDGTMKSIKKSKSNE